MQEGSYRDQEHLIPEDKENASKTNRIQNLDFKERYKRLVNQKAQMELYEKHSTIGRDQRVSEEEYLRWKNIYVEFSKQNAEDSLHQSLKLAYKKQLWFAYFIYNFSIMLHILTCLLLYFIFQDIIKHQYKSYENIVLTGIIIIVGWMRPFLTNYSDNLLQEVGLKMYKLISEAIVRKSLSCSVLSNKNITISQMSKIMHIDCEKLISYPTKNASVWEGALYFVLLSALIIYLAGWSGLAGLICMCLIVSVRYFMKKMIKKRENELNYQTGRRVKTEIEVFGMIKFIKANALESCYYNKLRKIRMDQVLKLKAKLLVDSIAISISIMTKQLSIVVIMKLISLMGGKFDAAVSFSINLSFALLNLQSVLKNFTDLQDVKSSIKKIEELLNAQEMDSSYLISQAKRNQIMVSIKDGKFHWDTDQSHKNQNTSNSTGFQLKNINLSIKKGELISIIGTYGSGKSSFANCLLGQMKNSSQSEVSINGSIAYCSQVPWIMNDTVKNNIIFGKEFNKIKYEQAIVYASLEQDLLIFKDGDMTFIGQKGSTLSGGQKARISLARAIYSDADIYILDDILSAVDAHVGSFIFNQTIKHYLKFKTVLLITHSLYFVKHTDRILIFENGNIVKQGTYQELQHTDILQEVQTTELKKRMSFKQGKNKTKKQSQELARRMSIEEQYEDQLGEQEKDIISTREALRVYIRRNSGCFFVFWLLAFTLIIVFLLASFRVMLNVWSFSKEQGSDKFLFFLLGINFVQAIFTYLLSMILYTSKMFQSLHDDMIKGLLFSPFSYFQNIPFDRIVNRLSTQLNQNDKAFTTQFIQTQIYVQYLLTYFSCILFVYGQKNEWLLFSYIIAHFGITIYFYQKYLYFNLLSNKLEQSLTIPVKSKFSEILNGLSTIRAYKRIQVILEDCFRRLELFGRASKLRTQVGIQIKYIVAFSINLNIVLSLVVVFFIENAIGHLTIFLLFNVFAIQDSTLRFHKSFFEVVARFKALGRCEQIARLQPQKGYMNYLAENYAEEQDFKKQYFGNQIFPRGEVVLQNYSFRYKAQLGDVLKNLNLLIRPGEKIGIIGRTGSGKSSMMLGLLRILQASSGKIIIDGIDISTLSLQQLRSNINIILQEHFLFTGILRENVDPTNTHNDAQVINALKLCGVWQEFQKREGLKTLVEQGGNNLSSGEKQLINISRSLLNPKRIVLIDEATASIDLQTDAFIQKVIKKQFADKTVLTIAHRINTVVDSDRILVLNKGKIAQFDSPANLLKNQASLFAQLYKEAGKKKQE